MFRWIKEKLCKENEACEFNFSESMTDILNKRLLRNNTTLKSDCKSYDVRIILEFN